MSSLSNWANATWMTDPSFQVVSPAGTDAATGRRGSFAVEGISLAFGGVSALADVDMAVAPGEIRAIIGPNGAGKSSLLNVISGIYRPDKGRIQLNGHDLPKMAAGSLARLGVARTFQNLALFKGLSVTDNVAAGLSHTVRSTVFGQMLGSPRARREQAMIAERAYEALTFFHLEMYGDRIAGTLPYGVQKRVELARAVVSRPALLLLDEPMAGITLTEKRELAEYIRSTRASFGTTIVLIEHDIGIVMELADLISVLDYGRKIADGTPDSIQADEAVIAAYLGVGEAPDLLAGA